MFKRNNYQQKLKNQARQIREVIIKKAAQDGGHLASPLGAVEIIQALMIVFDFTKDKVFFDVGHQAHAYKLMTARSASFETMGKKGGLHAYPHPAESRFDFYIGGHSGTSISAALGYAINNPKHTSVAVIGDGALTGGQPFEAMNQAGFLKARLVVVYNDNNYSTLKNVGFLHSKKKLKQFSQSLGFEYIGVVNGHDHNKLINALNKAKSKKHPIFLHVKTKKGKGYEPAERDPVKYHHTSPFDFKTGRIIGDKSEVITKAVVSHACQLKAKYKDIYFVTPAAGRRIGLSEVKRNLPESFIDTGINEQHCVSFCAALAMAGSKVICFLPAAFLPRAIDQIIDLCLMNAPVTFVLLRPGIGDAGSTHQGIYTSKMLNGLPNATLLNPLNIHDFNNILDKSLQFPGVKFIQEPIEDFAVRVPDNKIVEINKGNELSVLVIGNLLKPALKLASRLYGVQILFARQMLPIDAQEIYRLSHKTGRLLILEDGLISSGVGQQIVCELSKFQDIKFEILGANSIPQNGTLSQIYEDLGLSDEQIFDAARKLISK